MRSTAVASLATLAFVLLALASGAAPNRPGTVHWGALARAAATPTYAAHLPADAVSQLARAYSERSLTGLDALLAADFRFHFAPSDSFGGGYAEGLSREDEMSSSRAMFFGGPAGSGLKRPDSIFVTCGAIEEGVDPEHPDSTCQYRLAIAHDFRFRIVFLNDSTTIQTNNDFQAFHVFHLVRGDVALRAEGQPADTTRWYIRRWLEDLDAITIALGKIDGECGGSEEDAPQSIAPALLGLRAINAPVCPTLKVLCDLPGSEPAHLEVFDVQGRRLAERTVLPASPGRVLIEAGSGKRFTPGAYWVRLSQAKRPPVTRLVMVAM